MHETFNYHFLRHGVKERSHFKQVMNRQTKEAQFHSVKLKYLQVNVQHM